MSPFLRAGLMRRRVLTLSALTAAVLALIAVGAAITTNGHEPADRVGGSAVAEPPPDQTQGLHLPQSQGPTSPPEGDEAAYQIARLRAIQPVAPSPSTTRISGDATHQPDLYAAEFVRRLVTQDYRKDREAQLSWVQAESASTTEPLVVGMVPPELRDRLAIYSVSDTAAGSAPIPSEADWEGLALQHAYTTVTIQRVTEPFAWTNAVASGRISDPGISGREVSATVTRHSWVGGRDTTSTFSVALSLNLEGPPTRSTWGFVAVISYTSIQVS
ncbi:hypothetical protein GCM10027053_47600 [Intrasporangium mesophilum]